MGGGGTGGPARLASTPLLAAFAASEPTCISERRYSARCPKLAYSMGLGKCLHPG